MKIRKLIYLLGAVLVASAFIGDIETSAATKKAKARTSVSSVKSKKKYSSTKKKTSTVTRKKKKRKVSSPVSTYKPYTPPAEPILNDSLTLLINDGILSWIPSHLNPGGLRVNSVITNKTDRTAKIGLNENFTYLPVTFDFISDLKKEIISLMPDSVKSFDISLNIGPKSYSYYINHVDKLPEQYRKNIPFVVDLNPLVTPHKGMNGDIIAMWPSHGRYFKPGSGSWMWQRPKLFQIVEDTFTLGYILPYAVPMIENAGAYVMLPRERDVNSNEVIVDNDTNEFGQIYSQPFYKEKSGATKWVTGEGEGFIYDLPDFRDTENPFENGTYRQTATVTSGTPSIAAWYADIPEDGEYAIYVSYKTLPNSTSDARYTVNYSGGTKEFAVNQKMGGGTWIYLGTFPLEAGYSDTEPVVTLSNISRNAGNIVTADAVKIGGGMGNIARSDDRNDIYFDPSTPEDISYSEEDIIISDESGALTDGFSKNSKSDFSKGPAPEFKTSGLPRFLEGARYWLQWAGMPEEIYSPYHGADDYKDDYTNRGHWVNYLAGGSRVLPGREGLHIPIDLTMALHSDAGKRADDSFVGTLGIYYTNGGDKYVDGTPRSNSRTLTDMLMRQITTDIRQTWEPDWTRRSMWDKSYVEARVPEVPTSLIEFMSHQNFADMKYGLDPAFRFTVSRSIYKAIGRFLAERKDRKFVVQPLPVKDFNIRRIKNGHYRLSWSYTPDRLEPTAVPDKYFVMERTADELGFHFLGETSETVFDVIVEDKDIHSFKIIAANQGGVSFPSEVLALRESPKGDDPVLIINGFTRVSGPENFSKDGDAGFNSYSDFGVPYIQDISFIGYQTEFRRNAGEAFGKSDDDFAAQIIAGNTFDYPFLHGVAIADAGKGFISASVGAVIAGDVKLTDYKIVDLILGKQKITVTGNGNTGQRFFTFPRKLQNEIREFARRGGDFFISGAYVLSDLYDYRAPEGSVDFANNTLGIKRYEGAKTNTGGLRLKNTSNARMPEGVMSYSNTLNKDKYIVENPDMIGPSGSNNSEVFATFSDTSVPAGIVTRKGGSHGVVMSIPFETIEDPVSRSRLMKSILDYLDK